MTYEHADLHIQAKVTNYDGLGTGTRRMEAVLYDAEQKPLWKSAAFRSNSSKR